MINNFAYADHEEKISFDICVLYAIGKGDISQDAIYELWIKYWCEEEEEKLVFPMSDIEFQLEQYSKTEIVKMLSNSKFNLKDKWGCIYWDTGGEHLISYDYIPLLIDMEELMKWVDKTGYQSLCPTVLYSLWVEWKKGGDI